MACSCGAMTNGNQMCANCAAAWQREDNERRREQEQRQREEDQRRQENERQRQQRESGGGGWPY